MNQELYASAIAENLKTFDLGLAGALCCLPDGTELLSLNTEYPRKTQFVFKKTPEIEQAASDYYKGTLLISARQYFDNLKMLKSRIYNS